MIAFSNRTQASTLPPMRPHQLLRQFQLPNGTTQAFCAMCGAQVILETWPPTVEIPCIMAGQIDALRAAAAGIPQRRPGPVRRAIALMRRFFAARRRWIDAGRPRPDGPTLAMRTAACAGCKHRRGNGVFSKCGACGCFLRPKQKMLTEQCPARKWGEPANSDCNCGGPSDVAH